MDAMAGRVGKLVLLGVLLLGARAALADEPGAGEEVLDPAATASEARAGEGAPAVALLLDTPTRTEIGHELLVALAEHGSRVLAGAPPVGDTPLVRAAIAQRRGRALGAQVVVWSEEGARGTALLAVHVDGTEVHRAPLPGAIDDLHPRVVATVAASLVDELGGAAPSAPAGASEAIVDAPGAAPDARAATIVIEVHAAAPAPAAAVVATAERAERPPSRFTLAVGTTFKSAGFAGFDLRVGYQAASGLRLGAWTTYGEVFDSFDWTLNTFGVELGGSSAGRELTLEYGLLAGLGVVAEHAEGPDLSVTSGLGAALVGGRVGVRVPLSARWSLRLDLSAALVELSWGDGTAWGWVSLLAERRL